jgi:GntR family histidine utilization transcriptional repressor
LTEEGRLVRRQGVGTFVIDRKPLAGLLEVRSIADEIARAGGRHGAQVHILAREQAPDWAAEALGLARRSDAFHSLLVHLNNHVPVQLAERWVNPAVAPHYLEQDFTQITPNQYLMEVAPIQEAQHVLEAVLPDRDAQRLLQIGPHEPCLLLNRRTWALGMAATQNRFIYPGSRYRLGGRFEVRGGHSPRYGL